MEDYVYVLDFLDKGRGDVPPHKRFPVVYGLGENQFTLLELVPRENIIFNIGERIYVGKDNKKRIKIKKIKGRIKYENLTSTAHGEMPYILLDIVHNNVEATCGRDLGNATSHLAGTDDTESFDLHVSSSSMVAK